MNSIRYSHFLIDSFIDRDPGQFGFILQHLRNNVEMLSYNSRASMSHHKTYVQLPEDHRALRDLFVEASYYGIEDLKNQLCKTNMLTNFIRILNNSQNPFDSISKLMNRLRAILLATGGVVGTSTIATQAEFRKIGQFIGWIPEDPEPKGEQVRLE